MRNYLLCVMGSYVDKIYQSDTYPREGDFSHARFITKASGGCPLNVACVAASKMVEVKALDYLNEDDSSTRFIITTLMSHGVDTTPIQYGRAINGEVIIMTSEKKRTMFVVDPLRPKYIVDDKMQDLLNNATYIYSLLHMIERSFEGLDMLLSAKEHGAKIIIDGSSKYDDPKRAEVLLRLADGLFINSTDYKRLCNCVGYDAKDYLLENGCEFVCITDGSKSSKLYTKENNYTQKSFKLKNIVDTTGAGDAFAGAFLAAQLQGKDYPESLRLAAASGAYACLKVGGQAGCCTMEQLEQFADSFTKGEK